MQRLLLFILLLIGIIVSYVKGVQNARQNKPGMETMATEKEQDMAKRNNQMLAMPLQAVSKTFYR